MKSLYILKLDEKQQDYIVRKYIVCYYLHKFKVKNIEVTNGSKALL
jgi:hypothetical protein